MDTLQDDPTIDTSTIPTVAPADGSLDFTHDGERFTIALLHPRVWTLFRVTRYATTPIYTLHELESAAATTWRAYRHDGRVTRLDAPTFRALLELALA